MNSPMYDALNKKYQSVSGDSSDEDFDDAAEQASFESPKYSEPENRFINYRMANGTMKKVPYPGINDEDDK